MSCHADAVEEIKKIINKLGEKEFAESLRVLMDETARQKKAACDHSWVLSQIAGDGYNCHKCGSWMAED